MNIPNVEYSHATIEKNWQFKTNNKGFRNYEDAVYSKEPGVIRILSVGDSHTFGYEVSQDSTYSAQLERLLKLKGISADVYNTGVSGFSTAEELVYIENEGIKYQPDYIILGFFANDYDDNIRSDLFELAQDSVREKKYEYLPGIEIQKFIYKYKIFRWLSENSYIYSFVFNSVWNYFKELSIEGSSEISLEYSVGNDLSPDGYKTDLAVELLYRMYRFCESHNIKLILIDIPYKDINGEVGSSLENILRSRKSAFFHYLFSFKAFNEKLNSSEMHRKKGHYHISDAAHFAIADYCAMIIQSDIKF